MGKVIKGKEQLTLRYGQMIFDGKDRFHQGIDIVKYKNQVDTIIAIDKGTVFAVRTGVGIDIPGSYGNYVFIQHENGFKSFYAHLKSVKVKKGQVVKKGQELGEMGMTGWATGIHLHFEVEKGGKIINPTNYVFGNKTFNVAKKKSIHEIALEVLADKWGIGERRKAKLIEAGYDYYAVQKEVTRIWEEQHKPVKKGFYYIVKPGDTLSEIATRFGTTYQKIAKDNNIANPNLIFPDQKIFISTN